MLGLFTARSKGQSFGYVLTNLKLVRRDKREAMALNLIMRQALGIGIPLMILGYFFGTPGILAWWLLNGIIVLIMVLSVVLAVRGPIKKMQKMSIVDTISAQ